MRIEYVNHACLYIEAGGVKLATDPWFNGPAYCNQWYPFPKPTNTDVLSDVDVILLSHGHEDHLHEPSLKTLPKNARVFFPYTWFDGTPDYIRSMGFEDVNEVSSFKTFDFGGVSVSYVVNGLDSIIIIEADGQVIVDVNDALHYHHKNVTDIFTRAIKSRRPPYAASGAVM